MFNTNKNVLWLVPTFLVLVSCVLAFPRNYGDQQVNFKIGFDLTQEADGEAALRIRDFQDSESYPRAVESSVEQRPGKHIRADSFSASEEEETDIKETTVREKKKKEHTSSKEEVESSEENDSDERGRSTQGIRSGDYDPEAPVKTHGRDSDPDSDENVILNI